MALHDSLSPGLVFAAWFLVSATALLLLRWAKRRAVNRTDATLCSVCNYVVDGLPTTVCPECGSDLQRAGVIRAGRRRSVESLTLIVFWTILAPLLGLAASGVLAQVIPYYSASGTVTLAPRSQSFSYVRIVWSGQGYRRPYEVKTLQLELATLQMGQISRTAHMELDPPTGHYCYEDAAGNTQCGQIDGDSLRKWMAGVGVTSDSPEVAADAADLAAAIHQAGGAIPEAGTARFAGISTHTEEYVAAPDPYFRLACFCVCIVIWLIGVQVILLRRSRIRARLRARPDELAADAAVAARRGAKVSGAVRYQPLSSRLIGT